MYRIALLTRRELGVALASPFFWCVVALSWLGFGLFFVHSVVPVSGGDLLGMTYLGTRVVFTLQVFLLPLLTMRSLAEERRTGTFEALVTTPVRDHEIVIAKFLNAWIQNAAIWLVFPLAFALLTRIGHGDPDLAVVFGAWFGLVLSGGVFCAIGVFASSLTQHQILAAFLSFIMVVFLIVSPPLLSSSSWFAGDGWTALRRVVAAGDLMGQIGELASGILDGVNVTYQVLLTGLFLLFTGRVLEIRKWK